MSKELEDLDQKDRQDEIFKSQFKTVIWSDVEYLELAQTVEPIAVDSCDYFPINVKWKESSPENDYNNQPEIKVSVINNIQNINQVINNIEIQQNFSIGEVEKEVINLAEEGEENLRVKVDKNQSNVFSSKKIKPKLISRLHDDIYSNDPLIKTLLLNPFFQSTILFSCSILITAFFLSNKTNLISQNTSFSPQNSSQNELTDNANILDINNLAEIPIESTSAKVEPENSPNSSTQKPPQLTNYAQINLPIIPPFPNRENPHNSPQNVGKNSVPLAPASNQNQVIMDRYYIPQNNQQNNQQNNNSNLPNQYIMTVVDRYYVQGNYPIPAQNSLPSSIPVEVKPAVNIPSISTVPQLPPPPPLLETNSSIPTFSPIVNPEISQNTPINQNEKTNHTYILQGVMNFEENSAALFKTGETVLRINPGEQISENGWILEKLENGQAILSKNGEILSLRVGESFSINLD